MDRIERLSLDARKNACERCRGHIHNKLGQMYVHCDMCNE